LVLECEHGVPPGSSVSRGGIAWRNHRVVSIKIWRYIRGMIAVDMHFFDVAGTYLADSPNSCATFVFTLSGSKRFHNLPMFRRPCASVPWLLDFKLGFRFR
jgi:hypothetical protein